MSAMPEAVRKVIHEQDPAGAGAPIVLSQEQLIALGQEIEDTWVCIKPHSRNEWDVDF